MTLKEALKEELRYPLPGVNYQKKMAPEGRFAPLFHTKKKINAAVSILLYRNNAENSIEMLLMKRPEYDGPHSGQVSLPGGKVDRSDSSLFETAVRETHEEIGIELHEDFHLGKLTPLHIMVSSFEVHPFVFFYPGIPECKIDKQEVQYIIKTSISSLMDDSLIKTTRLNVGEFEIEAPYYAISKEIVWGATAMILSEFIEILRRIKAKNPALF